MQSVSVSRRLAASREEVLAAIEDVEAFMLAGGFNEATVTDGVLHLVNHVGLARMELDLRLVEREGAVLAYEQAEGFFETMETVYEIDEDDDGVVVTATTDFALDLAVVGAVLDATVIKRQRRKELEAQFDWLEDQLTR
jgi:xanthine/CO dehydrogenase XdhC/CoxF family maturation factor